MEKKSTIPWRERIKTFFSRQPNIEPLKLSEDKRKEEKRDVWILSIDGGGIRGIIPAFVLDSLQETLNEMSNTEAPIASYFDLVSGTSTGGLIALCLSKNNPISTKEVKSLYLNKNKIFFPPQNGFFERLIKTKYSDSEMMKFLDEIFKEEKLESLNTNVLIMSYDIQNGEPFALSNGATPGFPLKLAARATIAAPTYYTPLNTIYNGTKRSLIDGGVIANNPVLWAVMKAKLLYPNYNNIHVVSLGNFAKKATFDETSTSFSWIDITRGTLPIYSLYHSASMQNANYIATLSPDIDYIRLDINKENEPAIKMDDTSLSSINRLTLLSNELIQNSDDVIKDTAEKLIRHKKLFKEPSELIH